MNHPKNEWMFTENWGVDLFVSTPTLITAMVEEAVSVGKLVEILRFEGGLARLVEVTLADDASVVGQAIKDISLPREATIVAILPRRAPRGTSRGDPIPAGRRSPGPGHAGLRRSDPHHSHGHDLIEMPRQGSSSYTGL